VQRSGKAVESRWSAREELVDCTLTRGTTSRVQQELKHYP
jgi:hypothetical protein